MTCGSTLLHRNHRQAVRHFEMTDVAFTHKKTAAKQKTLYSANEQ